MLSCVKKRVLRWSSKTEKHSGAALELPTPIYLDGSESGGSLCKDCVCIVRDLEAVLSSGHRHFKRKIQLFKASIDELRKSVDAGCALCCMLWHEAAQVPETLISPLQDYPKTSIYWRILSNIVTFESTDSFKPTIDCHIYFEHGTDRQSYKARHQVLTGASTEGFLPVATAWLASCDRHHDCGKRQQHFVPTRLLEVCDASFAESLRVVDAAHVSKGAAYATLSHRWGRTQNIARLLTDNTRDYGIEVEGRLLSKTFQDAISITRGLRLRYLWIDSLCIVQDSAQDWHRECGQLADIYRHAYINIAASASLDGNGGCFQERVLSHIPPFMVVSSGQRPIVFRPESQEWTQSIDHNPLNRRGWVLQERLFSPRTIHFARHQVFWECNKLKASETCPDGLSWRLFDAPNITLRSLQERVDGDRVQLFSTRSPYDLFSDWSFLVESYANTTLTYKSDRLPAFSAIAKEFHVFLGKLCPDEPLYLAGIWRGFFPFDLLWSHITPGGCRSPEYCAPSWSWASSMEGSIYFNIRFVEPSGPNTVAKLVDAYTQPVKTDPFLTVRDGSLYIQSSIRKVIDSDLFHRDTFNTSCYNTFEFWASLTWDETETLAFLPHCAFYLLPLCVR